ncbi:hypothetical protein ACF0H5_010349 [Mactra antiquata]
MAFYKLYYDNINFIAMSDDIEWVKENLVADNIFYSPFKNKTDDLALMTKCQHMIIAYSTFGWWGSWMANGTTVFYDTDGKNKTRLGQVGDNSDYFTPRTFLIS